MLPILGRGALRCLSRSRIPQRSANFPSAVRPLVPSLGSFRFNSSLPQPPTPPPGFTSELVKPALSERPQAPPSILDKVVPKWAEKAKPYLHLIRIDKPIGSILLFWPGGGSTRGPPVVIKLTRSMGHHDGLDDTSSPAFSPGVTHRIVRCGRGGDARSGMYDQRHVG